MATIETIKAANEAIGHHFFEPDTMRFFKSRILAEVYEGPGGVYFVSSERPPVGPREYRVRRANPDGTISTMSTGLPLLDNALEDRAFASATWAESRARQLAREGV